jgi:hypothetical protein
MTKYPTGSSSSTDSQNDRENENSIRLMPNPAQQVAAVLQVVAIRGKNFECDRAIVTCRLKRTHIVRNINIAGSERQMKICTAAFVIVKMHVLKPVAIRGQNLIGGIVRHQQIGMSNIKVEAQFRHRVQQLSQLLHGVETSRQILDHQRDPIFPRQRQQLTNGLQVALDDKSAFVQRRFTVGMNVHPGSAQLSERFEA